MTDRTVPIDDDLLRYFAIRQEQRAKRIEATLRGMNPRERALIREAAVMGYVRGTMATGYHPEVKIPPDLEVLAEVVACCLDMTDYYPQMERALRRTQRREMSRG